jgi:alpha-tubulin suppressor-like RCC1 family protein
MRAVLGFCLLAACAAEPLERLAGDSAPALISAEDCTFSSLALGHHLQCGLVSGGRVACWGENVAGEVGNGSVGVAVNQPTEVLLAGGAPLAGASAVTAFDRHACALVGSGIQCWGEGGSGRLGDGSEVDRASPVDVVGTGFSSVSAGAQHTCAVAGGQIRCWGENGQGRLGDGTNMDRSTPVVVAGSGWKQVSAGAAHTCAVRAADGAAFCWGNNGSGRLGDGTNGNRSTPTAVLDANGSFTGVDRIEAGLDNTCARKLDGSLWCWGENQYGTLGDGTTMDRNRATRVVLDGQPFGPVQSFGLIHYTLADNSAACAVRNDQTLWCWGDNTGTNHFLLGQGGATPAQSSEPLRVKKLAGQATPFDPVDRVVGGYDLGCARTLDGRWWCWGHYFGDPGDGLTDEDRSVPVRVICPECKTSAACAASPFGPICDTSDWACGECQVDNQCAGATPRCDRSPVHNVCVACDGDFGSSAEFACPSAATPVCTTDGCRECAADRVERCTPAEPACESATGTCAPCTGDLGSGASAPCPTTDAPACQDGLCVAVALIVAPTGLGNDATPTYRGTATPGSPVQVFVDGGDEPVCTAVADASGMWSCSGEAELADGGHTAEAQAGDGPRSSAVDFTIDTVAPAVTLSTPTAGSSSDDATPTYSGTAEPGATVHVIVDGVHVCAVVADEAGAWSCTPEVALPPGPHTVSVSAEDAAGNAGQAGPHAFAVAALDDDRDDDGVADDLDNCPDDANPEQTDLDRDGQGDACDAGYGVSGGGCASTRGGGGTILLLLLLVFARARRAKMRG